MAENYNDLQLKRDELIKSSGANNPKVAETSVKIENLRKDIIGSLTSIHNFIKSSVTDLEKRTGATGEQLQQAAVQDRTFLEFSRRQRVKEELYLYLLKKREAVAISKSLNFDQLSIVDPPKAETIRTKAFHHLPGSFSHWICCACL